MKRKKATKKEGKESSPRYDGWQTLDRAGSVAVSFPTEAALLVF